MATDLERLVVSLDADITKLTKQLSRAGVQLDGFDRDVDQKTKRIAKRANDNLGTIANDNRALRGDQLRNLGFQLNDIASGLASGQSPMTILAQQGGQVYQVLGDAKGGVGGAVKDLAARLFGLVTPIRVAAGGVLSIAAAAAYLGTEWLASQDKAQAALRGIGGASGATVGQINRVAAAASSAGVISTGAARDIATSLAATGKIDVGNFGKLLDLAPGFAKVFTDGDLAKAGPELARIFSDPVKGADELDARLGVLDDRTRQYIRTLAAQGDRQGAIAALARAVAPELARAAEQTSIWARAFNAVKSAADGAGEAAARAVSKGTPQEQAARSEQQRRQAADTATVRDPDQEAFLRNSGATQKQIDEIINPTAPGAARSTAADIAKITGETEHLAEVARRASQGDFEDAMNKIANPLSKGAGDTVRELDAEGQAIESFAARYKELGDTLASSRAAGKLEDVDKAKASYDALGKRLE